MKKIRDIYYVTQGVFQGNEGYLTNIAGQIMLKNPEPKEGDWSYCLVPLSQLELLCSIEI